MTYLYVPKTRKGFIKSEHNYELIKKKHDRIDRLNLNQDVYM